MAILIGIWTARLRFGTCTSTGARVAEMLMSTKHWVFFFIIKHWVLVLQKRRRKERKILSRGRSGFRAAWAPWSWIQTLHRKAIANWPSHGSVALDSAAASVGARTEAGAHMNHGRCHAVRRYDDG
jgi:hypothetical protein